MAQGSSRAVRSWSHGRLIAEAAAFVSQFPESLLVIPRPGTSPLLGVGDAQGLAGVHHRTITQLASDFARKAMAQRQMAPLSALAMEAVTARIVHESRGQLEYFAPVADSPGFPRALARTLADLRLAHARPAEVHGTGPPGRDLALLLTAYETELDRRGLADLAAILTVATAEARQGNHRLLGLPLVLLDAPLDWPTQREFIDAVAEKSPAVLRAYSSADVAARAADDLDAAAAENSLDHLRRNLFQSEPSPFVAPDDRFEFFSAPGEGLEAAEIARRVLRLAREGVPFDRVAILLRSPERYQPMVEEALRRAAIPAWFSRGATRPDPAGRAFLALLACAAERVSASRFAEYLSLAQVPRADASGAPQSVPERFIAPEDELLTRADEAAVQEPVQQDDEPVVPEAPVAAGSLRAPSAWEKLLVDAAVIGGYDRWERRLLGLEHELELHVSALENEPERRAGTEQQLERLRHLKHFALPLVDALHALPSAADWATWIEKLGALARLALRNPDPVLAVLAELEPMADVGPAGLEEVTEVLSDRLRFLRRDSLDRPWGRVFVGSIDEARGREFGVVFLPGLAEGLFPQRAAEDPLLLDSLRTAANSALPLRTHRVDEERRRLHLAAGAARDRLVASYPRMDVATARPRVPSFYALELPRALEGALPDLDVFEKRAREAAPARLNRPGPQLAADAIDDAEYDLVAIEAARDSTATARYLMETNPHLARSVRARYARWRPAWKEADGLVTVNPAALTALATHQLAERAWSPSALQRFAVCPYQFMLHGIQRLEPREESVAIEQLDPLTRGALFHEVQFALLSELKSAALLPVTNEILNDVLARSDKVLNRLAAEYAERLAPAVARVWDAGIEDLRIDLRGWLQHVARNDDDWLPVHFELAFGLRKEEGRDPSSSAEEAVLREGVRLRGSIDLVERNVATGAHRVTDHKTGQFPERTPHLTGGGKALQPLLYGLAAEKLLGSPVESGRLFYSSQRGQYKFTRVELNQNARFVLTRLLADINGSIAGGFLPPFPEKDACGYCDYRIVCGPYEERRSAKKSGRDERLEGLIEIRGMA